MKSDTSKSTNQIKLRQWIEDLTEYTPQQIDQVMKQMPQTILLPQHE